VIDCNEWKTEKRHEFANMGKVKRLELRWQLYRTSLPVRDLENFRPMDFFVRQSVHCPSCLMLNLVVRKITTGPVRFNACYCKSVWSCGLHHLRYVWVSRNVEHEYILLGC